MAIFNMTQHAPTAEQVAAGVGPRIQEVCDLLTFETLPDAGEIESRAKALVALVPQGTEEVMIGGAPFLMAVLQNQLHYKGLVAVFSFSVRVSTEETLPNGEVRKVNTFRHAGWVRPQTGMW